MSFKRVEDDIRPILKYSEAARADDMALYTYYVAAKTEELKLGYTYLQRIFTDRRFRLMHGIAPYETVSRVRRKRQAADDRLKPSVETIAERKRSEKQYKEYARQKGGAQ